MQALCRQMTEKTSKGFTSVNVHQINQNYDRETGLCLPLFSTLETMDHFSVTSFSVLSFIILTESTSMACVNNLLSK